jgi:hypothetical protein
VCRQTNIFLKACYQLDSSLNILLTFCITYYTLSIMFSIFFNQTRLGNTPVYVPFQLQSISTCTRYNWFSVFYRNNIFIYWGIGTLVSITFYYFFILKSVNYLYKFTFYLVVLIIAARLNVYLKERNIH